MNLAEQAHKFAEIQVREEDSAVSQYLRGQLEHLRSIGADLTQYEMVRLQHPPQLGSDGMKVVWSYRLQKVDTYSKSEVIDMIGEDTSCSTCDRLIKPNHEWFCENCNAIFHEGCEGYSYSGDGEYPEESAFAICEECFKKGKA